MSQDRAEIRAELTGANKVEADAKKISRALTDAKKTVGEEVQGKLDQATAKTQIFGAKVDALKGAINPTAILGGVIGGAVLTTIGAVVGYLGESAAKARDFGEKTSATSRRTGLDLASLRSQVQKNAVETLQSADAQLEFVDAVQKTSYGSRGAEQSLRGLGQIATASGKSLSDYVALVGALQQGLNIKGDVSGEIENLTRAAERLGTAGGAQALLDTITALRPALAAVSDGTSEATQKLTAMAAVLSGKLKPEQVQARVQGAVGLVEGRWLDIERTLGHEVLDEHGRAKNPLQTLKELRGVADRMYGKKESAAKRRAVFSEFGPQLGSVMLNDKLLAQMEEEDKRLHTVQGSDQRQGWENYRNLGAGGKNEKYEAFLQSAEGQRAARAARADQRALEVGAPVLAVQDAWDSMQDAVAGAGADAVRGGPAPGASAGPRDEEVLIHLGKIADNTGQGLKVDPESLKAAMQNVKLNVQIPVNPQSAPGNG